MTNRTHSLLLALLCCGLSGCFSYGLPEVPAQFAAGRTQLNSAQVPDILLVSNCAAALDSGEFARRKKTRLGHQFILGIIPMTSLFLQHGAECLAEDAALQYFAEQGLTTAVVSADGLPAWSARVHPESMLQIALKDFSANAYDLIVVRRLVVSGTLNGVQYDRAGGRAAEIRVPVSASEFAIQGQASQVAQNMRKAVHDAMAVLAARLPPRSIRAVHTRTRAEDQARDRAAMVLVIAPPVLQPTGSLGALLAQSYGVPGMAAYSPGAVGRVFQRGLQSGLPAASAGSIFGEAFSPADGWRLDSSVERLAAVTDPYPPADADRERWGAFADVTFILRQGSAPIRRAKCEAFAPVESRLDGAWVIAVERAAQAASREFMQPGPAIDERAPQADGGASGLSAKPSAESDTGPRAACRVF